MILLIAASSTLMLAFQNCGKAQKAEETESSCQNCDGSGNPIQTAGNGSDNEELPSTPVVPTLRASDASVIEGMEAMILFTLDQPTTQAVEFAFETVDGTGLADVDYVPKSGRVVIPAGELNSAVTIVTLNDGKTSSSKSVKVKVSEPKGVTLVDASQGDIEIADIVEYGKSISIVASDATTKQGSAALVSVLLNQPSLQDVSVRYELSDDTAKAGQDYTDASGTVTIKKGSRSAEISVATLKDDVYSGADKKLKLTLSSPVNGVLGEKTVGVITIQDNESMPVIEVANVTNAKEGEKASIKLELSGKSTRDVSFKVMTKAGSATANDFAPLAGNFTIPAGLRDVTISTAVNTDSLAEGQETFSFVISDVEGATLAQSEVAVKILAGSAPVATLSNATVIEGGRASLMLRLTEAAATPVKISWHTALTAAADGASRSDFVHASGISHIPKGASAVALLIQTHDDALDEGEEKFNVVIDSIEGADYLASQAVVAITDNDVEPELSLSPDSVREGGRAKVIASLNKPSGRAVSFTYSTVDETAKGGEDYTAATAVTVTIPAGEQKASIWVQTAADMDDEPSQTLLVRATSATNARIKTGSTRVTILNSDPQLSIVGSSISEGGLMVFTLYLNFPARDNVEINLKTRDGSASAAHKDYTAITAKKIILRPGTTRVTVAVQTLHDNKNERDEQLYLVVESMKGVSHSSQNPAAVGVILGR